MKFDKKILLSSLTAAMLVMSGCGSDSSDGGNGGDEDNNDTTSGCLVNNVLTGTCSEDTTVSADTKFEGLVKVKDGATLTIDAGVTLYGTTQSSILIAQGSKIIAKGTADSKITFTSIDAYNGGEAAGKRGQWGGLAIMGQAPTNESADDSYWEVYPEDPDAKFGGDIENDNSGELSYVDFKWASYAPTANKETNALSLCAVGNETTINNIMISDSNDDGVEFWGGSVNVDTITVINAADDSIDLDSGYQGTITNVTITHKDEAAASFVEASTGGDATVRVTKVNISNAVMTAGAGTGTTDDEGGLYLKSAEVEFTYDNVTLNMDASTGTNGAFYAKKATYDVAPVLNNITVNDANSARATATGDGAATVDTAFAAGTNNVRN